MHNKDMCTSGLRVERASGSITVVKMLPDS